MYVHGALPRWKRPYDGKGPSMAKAFRWQRQKGKGTFEGKGKNYLPWQRLFKTVTSKILFS
jgi:hypothetical protein